MSKFKQLALILSVVTVATVATAGQASAKYGYGYGGYGYGGYGLGRVSGFRGGGIGLSTGFRGRGLSSVPYYKTGRYGRSFAGPRFYGRAPVGLRRSSLARAKAFKALKYGR